MKTFGRRTFFLLALLTLIGMGAIGVLVLKYIYGLDPYEEILGGFFIPTQILIGLGYGIAAAIPALYIISQPFLQTEKNYFSNLMGQSNLKFIDILFISFSAGVGEEILFRAAIQQGLGIWLTALIFVAIHGYILPKKPKQSIYGLYLVLVSAGFGYLTIHIGLISAITAHFIIDVILFAGINTNALSLTSFKILPRNAR